MTAAEITARYADIRKRLYNQPQLESEKPVVIRPVPIVHVPKNLNLAMWEIIMHDVCEQYRIGPRSIIEYGRRYDVCAARHECWYRVRRDLRPSYQKMAKWFRRDYSTIAYGVRVHREKHGLEWV